MKATAARRQILHEGLEANVDDLSAGLADLDVEVVAEVCEALLATRRRGRRVFLFGNGGSAALASHMACDLNHLPAPPGFRPFDARSLVDNVAVLTALANDTSYENVFSAQIDAMATAGDLAVAISCSGESANVLRAVEAARAAGLVTVALTGDAGGRLAGSVDLCVRAPAAQIWQQENLHLAVEHAICDAIRQLTAATARRVEASRRAIVLCAGLGTRLGDLVRDRPKPMVPIGGQPALELTLAWLRRYGFERVAINLHHHPESVMDHFGDGSDRGLDLVYYREPELLGTAGAIARLDGFVAEGPLLVVYGDVLTDLDLLELMSHHSERVLLDPSTAATLAVHHVPEPSRAGLVELDGDGRVTAFVEKPPVEEVRHDLGSAGVLVLEPAAIAEISRDGASDLAQDLFPALLEKGYPIFGWALPATARLIDFGTPETYRRAQREWGGGAAS